LLFSAVEAGGSIIVKSQVRVSFEVLDFEGLPSDITNVLGVRPTKTWRKGDRIQKSALLEKENGWSIESDKAPAEQLSELIRRVVASLKGSKDKLAIVSKNCYTQLSLVLYVHGDERPELHLDADIVQRLAELGAHVDADMYFLSS